MMDTIPLSPTAIPPVTPTARMVGVKWSVALTLIPPIGPPSPMATLPISALVSPLMLTTDTDTPIAPAATVIPTA